MARRYGSQELNKAYEMNGREKKRQYNERILEVEHGSFTPLVAWEGKPLNFTLFCHSRLPKNVKSDTVYKKLDITENIIWAGRLCLHVCER